MEFKEALKQWLMGDSRSLQELVVDQFLHYLEQFPETLSLLKQAELKVAVTYSSSCDPVPYLLINYQGFPPELIYSYNTQHLDRLCYAWYQLTDIDRVAVMGTDAYTGQKVLVQAEVTVVEGVPQVQLYSYAGGRYGTTTKTDD